MKKAMISTALASVLIFNSMGGSVLANNQFNDVPKSHPYVEEIHYLSSKGIISGYTDGNFKPTALVNRSQASKIIWSALEDLGITKDFKKVQSNQKSKFSDVGDESWFKEYVENMYLNGIISGYADGSFRPQGTLTRSQVSKILAESFGMTEQYSDIPYHDVDKDAWYAKYVNNMYTTGVIEKTKNNKFEPQKVVTREELSNYVAKAMKWYQSKERYVAGPTLPEHEKYPESYKILKEGLSETNEWVNFNPAEMNTQELNALMQELINEDDDGFFINRWWTYSDGRVRVEYSATRDVIKKRKEQVEQAANEIIKKLVKPHYSEYDKVKAVHDYIVLNTAYDYENFLNDTVSRNSYTAFGSLIEGVAVCDGYTKATSVLLDKLGIENHYVVGYLPNGGLHSWNMVKISGEYYHLDTTWDDPVPNRDGYVSHKYFLVTTDQLLKEGRKWEVSQYPTSSKLAYPNR